MSNAAWEHHYNREKSALSYPDENLVRLIKSNLKFTSKNNIIAVDLGCGSGRHLKLLDEIGIKNVFGTDLSYTAAMMSWENFNLPAIISDTKNISLKNNSVDIAIAWGSLHYNTKDDLQIMLKEIKRILKDDGQFYATLRSDHDSYLKRGKHLENNTWVTDLNDIEGSTVSFYNEAELKEYFKLFNVFKYGIIERSIIGDIDSILSHWIIFAQK